MPIKAIHQFTPVFVKHDAIGNTLFQMRKLFYEWGYESEIFVETQVEQTSDITKKYTYYTPDENDLIIYHHSIGSALAAFMEKITTPKILFYHNITPPSFFESYDQIITSQLFQGVEQTKRLAKSIPYAMAASNYNKFHLSQYGYQYILDAQYFINLERFDAMKPKKEILEKFSTSKNIIFVGRRVPNKKIEDILKVFAYYKILNPNSKLFLLGGSWSIKKYVQELNELESKLSFDKDDVIIINTLTDKELQSYYKIADIFLCMSEHEGFCIPLVESMYFDIPIVAYNSTAVPDTLGDSGILVNHKKFGEIAELIHMIIGNKTLRDEIIQNQQKRLSFFSDTKAKDLLKNNIEKILSDN